MQSDKNIAGVSEKNKSTYKEIFSSSLIVGGTQFITLFFNLIRAKVLAVVLGAGGTGIIGLYTSTALFINSLFGLGIRSSAVRQVAVAAANNDDYYVKKTVKTLRITVVITSLVAALLVILFSERLSELTFDNKEHIGGIMALSIVVLLSGISDGQFALLQGLRKIKDLAKSKIAGAVLSSIIGIILILVFKEDGIIPFVVSGSLITVLLSWFFARKIKVFNTHLSVKEYKTEAGQLIKVGLSFLASALILHGTNYFSRIIISQTFDVDTVGLYTAAYTLSIVYINFVLAAMATDFYPRLTGIAKDNKEVNRMVNEQTVMGLILSMTGVLSIIAFPSFFLTLFYSKEFTQSSSLLQFLTIGMVVKIITWPIGFIIVAKGRNGIFVLTETSWGILYIVALFLATKTANIANIGVAFFATYILHSFLIVFFSKRLANFKWDKNSKQVILIFLLCIALIFFAQSVLNGIFYIIFTVLLLFLNGYYCLRKAKSLLKINVIESFKRKILKR